MHILNYNANFLLDANSFSFIIFKRLHLVIQAKYWNIFKGFATPPPTPPPGSILKPLKGSQCAQTHTVLYKPIHAKHNFFPSWLMP